jgi:protein phosphatase
MIVAAGRTHVGRVRTRNEDAYVVASLDGSATARNNAGPLAIEAGPALLAVADGVGGAVSGELASLMGIDTLLIELRDRYAHGQLRSPATIEEILWNTLLIANTLIHAYATEHPDHRGMATTATGMLILPEALWIGQVGDSRAYLVRPGIGARQLTKDQTLVQRLLDIGEITESEALHSNQRNIILQALGSTPAITPIITAEPYEPGDVVVLCSDGLSNVVTDEEIATVTLGESQLDVAGEHLVALANARGGPDNITVIVARIDEVVIHRPVDAMVNTEDAALGQGVPATLASTSPGFAARVRQLLR